MLGLTFSSKLDLGSYFISVAKTASKKSGALICSIKFPFLCGCSVSLQILIYHTPMYGILLSRLGWCPHLLLEIVRQATQTNMHDYCSFTCCLS